MATMLDYDFMLNHNSRMLGEVQVLVETKRRGESWSEIRSEIRSEIDRRFNETKDEIRNEIRELRGAINATMTEILLRLPLCREYGCSRPVASFFSV